MKKFIKIEYSCSYCSICFFSAYVYIVPLLCSMDVQCSDGRSMLLRYASSYVTKLRDHQFIHGEYIFYMQNITTFCIEMILLQIAAHLI